ncbi:MAG: hypothetical protein LBL59_07280 [Xanthomonadaceae bacterium]|jgi:hypothetical protein|nr:hypothetical protein [Xanthomonadaceae bacterium]
MAMLKGIDKKVRSAKTQHEHHCACEDAFRAIPEILAVLQSAKPSVRDRFSFSYWMRSQHRGFKVAFWGFHSYYHASQRRAGSRAGSQTARSVQETAARSGLNFKLRHYLKLRHYPPFKANPTAMADEADHSCARCGAPTSTPSTLCQHCLAAGRIFVDEMARLAIASLDLVKEGMSIQSVAMSWPYVMGIDYARESDTSSVIVVGYDSSGAPHITDHVCMPAGTRFRHFRGHDILIGTDRKVIGFLCRKSGRFLDQDGVPISSLQAENEAWGTAWGKKDEQQKSP